jgi:hypothetical protein
MGQAVGICTEIRLSSLLGVLPATAVRYGIAYSSGCSGPIRLSKETSANRGNRRGSLGRQQPRSNTPDSRTVTDLTADDARSIDPGPLAASRASCTVRTTEPGYVVGAAVYPERVLVASATIDGHAVALRLERADTLTIRRWVAARPVNISVSGDSQLPDTPAAHIAA